jgi:hypothetical protein
MLTAGGALWYWSSRGPEDAASTADAGGTGVVKLAWDKSLSARVVGYRVLYGTQPRRYDRSMEVGDVDTATLAGLRSGSRYFIAVVALDAQGNQSPPSKEISAVAR